jgi:hypothetical protein
MVSIERLSLAQVIRFLVYNDEESPRFPQGSSTGNFSTIAHENSLPNPITCSRRQSQTWLHRRKREPYKRPFPGRWEDIISCPRTWLPNLTSNLISSRVPAMYRSLTVSHLSRRAKRLGERNPDNPCQTALPNRIANHENGVYASTKLTAAYCSIRPGGSKQAWIGKPSMATSQFSLV